MELRIITTNVVIHAAWYLVRPKKMALTTMRLTSILEVLLFGSRLGEQLYRVRTVDPEDAGAVLLRNICNCLPVNTVHHLNFQLTSYCHCTGCAIIYF